MDQKEQAEVNIVSDPVRRMPNGNINGEILTQTLAQAFKLYDNLLTKTIIEERVVLACCKGCHYCCYLKVDARAHEILYIAEYLKKNVSEEKRIAIYERARTHASRIRDMSAVEHLGSNNPCPLLEEGSCIAYEVRPMACRNFHAENVKTCIDSFNDPRDLISPGSEHSELKYMGALSLMEINKYFASKGYDERTYDLGAGLFEALRNDTPLKKWLKHKHAFSDAVCAKVQR